MTAGKQLIAEHTKAVDIAANVDFAIDLFWCDVAQGADDVLGQGGFRTGADRCRGDAEVEHARQERVALDFQSHVVRLDIAVDHAASMGVTDRAADLHKQPHTRVLVELPLLGAREKRWPVHELHRQIRFASGRRGDVTGIEDLHDAVVIQPGQQHDFASKPVEHGIAGLTGA